MCEVKIMVPNNLASDFNKITLDDIKKFMALYYYFNYKNGDQSLEDIASKMSMSIYELVKIYGDMELPLIVGNVADYENELKALEKTF